MLLPGNDEAREQAQLEQSIVIVRLVVEVHVQAPVHLPIVERQADRWVVDMMSPVDLLEHLLRFQAQRSFHVHHESLRSYLVIALHDWVLVAVL